MNLIIMMLSHIILYIVSVLCLFVFIFHNILRYSRRKPYLYIETYWSALITPSTVNKPMYIKNDNPKPTTLTTLSYILMFEEKMAGNQI